MAGNYINKTKYIKLKGLDVCGSIEEPLSAQQLHEFVHGIPVDVKVESKGKFEILFPAFENCLPHCAMSMWGRW